jgi:hypothetical protein
VVWVLGFRVGVHDLEYGDPALWMNFSGLTPRIQGIE